MTVSVDLDELEQLPESLFASMAQDDKVLLRAAVAELRAARKVVERARAAMNATHMNSPYSDALKGALAEYEAQHK